MRTFKVLFSIVFLAILASNIRLISHWSEARGVYDDICYLRQAHLFQRFGLQGIDTDLARDDDGYISDKMKEIDFPSWHDPMTAPCHPLMPATHKHVLQYPPGTGFVLAIFPAGFQVAPLYMSASFAVLLCGLAAIQWASTSLRAVAAAGFG